MKDTKLTGQGRQQRRIAKLQADIARTKKHTWYCELIVAACAGACLALAGVIAHMMITGSAWTW